MGNELEIQKAIRVKGNVIVRNVVTEIVIIRNVIMEIVIIAIIMHL